jgi:hypothetical protein
MIEIEYTDNLDKFDDIINSEFNKYAKKMV